MTNSSSPDAASGGAWCNRMIKQYSTAPADKQING